MSNTVDLVFRGDGSDLQRTMGQVGRSADQMQDQVGGASDKMQSRFSKVAGGMKVAGAGIGAVAGAAIVSAFDKSLEFDAANTKLKTQLGSGGTIAEDAGKIAGHLYANAYGESIGEVGDAVALVMKSGAVMEDDTNEHIEAITGKVMSLAGAFDQDLGGTVNAVAQMMRTGLAPSADEALDILTVGFQNGDDKAGDLLDTFNEYGTQFRKLGLDGKDALGLIHQGLAGGARDADLAADAIKEFSIRAIDGSKTTVDGFKSLGLNAEEMAKKIAAGGPTAKEGLDQVLDALRGIQDPAERSRIAVELFGTQAEDLGAALGKMDVSSAAQGLGDVADAAKKLDDTVGDTAKAKVEKLKRGYDEWAAGLIATKGPLGDVGAAVQAFGPDALGVMQPLGALLLALKMNGAVGALKAVSSEVDGVGAAAERSSKKTGGLMSSLRSGPSSKLGALGLAGAGAALFTEQMELTRKLSKDAAISIAVGLDPKNAQKQLGALLLQIKGTTGTLNINGRTLPAEDALGQVVAAINRGQGTVTLNGQSVPAKQALDQIVASINESGGTVTVNGQTVPAGDALRDILGQISGSRADLTVGANNRPAIASIGDAIRYASQTVTMTVRAVTQYISQAIPGRAVGGPVSAGQTYLVGERGPELLTMGGSGFVTPNHQLNSSSGGGSMRVELVVTGQGGRAGLASLLMEMQRTGQLQIRAA